MSFSPEIAAKRFGYGLSPRVDAPQSVERMLNGLRGPDYMQQRFAVGTYRDLQAQHVIYMRFNKHANANGGTPEGDVSDKKKQELRKQTVRSYAQDYVQTQLRRINTPDGFRERLVAFWADHFTAFGRATLMRQAAPQYVEEALRPHVGGRFVDMLLSAVRHPVMLHYLDQDGSVGSNSALSLRRKDGRGVNENLAREVLELHTLGVEGPYAQTDVRALANLFTGLTRRHDFSFRFAPAYAEPGPQNVMGRAYEGKISMVRIEAVLSDLAAHPATAAHIARKLAVHFVSDMPSDGLVADMTAAFLDSDGDLVQVYAAMLGHRDAWLGPATNIRPPDEFISASLRGLGVSADVLNGLELKHINGIFLRPLVVMGQTWLRPNGPDGSDEADGAWVTPQGVAGRMEWAMRAPKRLMDPLPDPKAVLRDALGANAPQKVVFAASAAESRAEAIGLILMSPAFQRR